MNNKHNYMNLPRKHSRPDIWKTLEVDNRTKIHFRIVDENIINQMPKETTTFTERGVLRSFINRMARFVETGS